MSVSTASRYKEAASDKSTLSLSNSRQEIRSWNSQKQFFWLSLLFFMMKMMIS
jgi:hypothetical protein